MRSERKVRGALFDIPRRTHNPISYLPYTPIPYQQGFVLQLGMSTFTYFLAEGLRGKADILGNNGVITLTELFLYVQYEVAKRTESNQIPMLGRMKGDGEMLFAPRTTDGAQPR